MAVQQYQWRGPQATRSKIVLPSAWATHKDELEHLYQRMKLDDVMSTMKEKYGLERTRRQYVFQFKKWGFKKNDKTDLVRGDNHDPLLRRSASPLSLLSEFPTPPPLPVANDSTNSHQAPLGIKRKTDLPVPPQKRVKLVNQVDVVGIKNDASTNISLGRAVELDFTYASTSHCSDSSPASSRTLSKEDASDNDNVRTLASATTVSSETSYLGNGTDKANEQHTQQQDEVHEKPVGSTKTIQATPSLLRLDVPDPLEALNCLEHDRFEDVVIAADFLAISQCPTDAFVLYILLVTRYLSEYDLRGWTDRPAIMDCLQPALIGCFRSAVTIPHLQIVKNLFEHQFDDRFWHGTFCVRELIQSTFLVDVYRRLGDKSAATLEFSQTKMCIRNVKKKQPEMFSLFHEVEECTIFLEACRVLRTIWYEDPSSLPKLSYWCQINAHVEHQSRRIVSKLSDNRLRLCLEWCHDKLIRGQEPPVTALLEARKSTYHSFVSFLSLYHWLFQALLKERKDSQLEGWRAFSEITRALSPAKSLAVITFMLFDHEAMKLNSTLPWFLTSEPREKLKLIFVTARSSCRSLLVLACSSELADSSELASMFVKAEEIITDGKFGRSEVTASTDELGLKTLTKRLAEDGLNLKLSAPPPIELAESYDVSKPSSDDQPTHRPKIDIIPTLAPSLHSSDYRSFISLKNHLVGGHTEGYDAALPSKFIEFGSKSTLSALLADAGRSLSQRHGSIRSSSYMGSDALDTLTTFSARARGGVVRDKCDSKAGLVDIETISTGYSQMSVKD